MQWQVSTTYYYQVDIDILEEIVFPNLPGNARYHIAKIGQLNTQIQNLANSWQSII